MLFDKHPDSLEVTSFVHEPIVYHRLIHVSIILQTNVYGLQMIYPNFFPIKHAVKLCG